MSSEKHDALILSLETRAGLAATRSLGRAGYRLAVASWGRDAPGMRTRFAATRVILPDPSVGSEACAHAIVEFLERNPAEVVLTSTDTGLTVLHENRELIGQHAIPAIASAEAIEAALSKQVTVTLADELGIPIPRSIPATSFADVEEALLELGLPAVLKPVHQWHRDGEGQGAFEKPRMVESIEEAREVSADLVTPDTPVLVQEMVKGGRFEHHQFFRAGGKTIARVTFGVERQWPPFGISALRCTVEPPGDTGVWSEKLVEAMNIEGCSSVQFKRDDEGNARLMEVNARLVQTLGAARLAGVDFARLQLEWARGGQLEEQSPEIGMRIGWLAGDLRLLASSASLIDVKPKPSFWPTARGVIPDYLLGRARIEGFDMDDRGPMLASIGENLRAIPGGLRSRRSA